MNIAPDAALSALRAEFPGFRVWAEPAGGRYRFVARRRHPGTGLHTVVTSDPAELRAALAAARSEQEPGLAGRVPALPPPRHGRPAASSGGLPDASQHIEVGGPDELRATPSWPA
jgi:hypothetical protein